MPASLSLVSTTAGVAVETVYVRFEKKTIGIRMVVYCCSTRVGPQRDAQSGGEYHRMISIEHLVRGAWTLAARHKQSRVHWSSGPC